jgi:hypothetical protein
LPFWKWKLGRICGFFLAMRYWAIVIETNSVARRQEHSDSSNRIVRSNMTFFHSVEVNVPLYLGAPGKI